MKHLHTRATKGELRRGRLTHQIYEVREILLNILWGEPPHEVQRTVQLLVLVSLRGGGEGRKERGGGREGRRAEEGVQL